MIFVVVSDDLPWARRQFSNSSYQVPRGLQLNEWIDKFGNQVEFLGHSAVTPKDIKRLTYFLFQSYCTATLHYGLRRERENMAKLSLRSNTKKSIYICCTFWVADVQYLPKKNNGWLQWCRKFDQNWTGPSLRYLDQIFATSKRVQLVPWISLV